MKSKLWKVNFKDLAKSIVLFFLTTLVGGLYELTQTGNLFDWPAIQSILGVALTATIGYLLKNLITNSNDKILKSELPNKY